MSGLAALTVAVPLLVAAILLGAGSRLPRQVADGAGLLTSLTIAAVGLYLAFASREESLVHWMGRWRPHGGIAIGIAFVVDPAASSFATLAAVLTAAGFIFGWRYFDSVNRAFHGLMLVFLAAMEGFCFTGDLFTLFVFFELMSVCAYALTALKIEEPSIEGAISFAFVNSVAAFLLLLGIGLVYARTGALNLAQIGQTLAAKPPDSLLAVGLALILGGLFTKAALAPMHFWLADAHAVAPTPASVLFSGVMVPLGIYGALRVYATAFRPALGPFEPALADVFATAGALTAVLGAIMCLGQQHLKRMLAYSTISHMGIAACGAATLGPIGVGGAGLYLLAHGLIKGSLFLAAGVLLDRFGSVEQSDLFGKAKGHWLLMAAWCLAAFGLAGLWPFATFWGKSLMEHGPPWAAWVFIFAGGATAGGVLRAGTRIFLGWGHRPSGPSPKPNKKPEPEGTPDAGRPFGISSATATAMVGLAALLGFFGLSGPAVRAAGRLLDSAAYSQTVLYGRPSPLGSLVPPPASVSSLIYLFLTLAFASSVVGVSLIVKRPRPVQTFADRFLLPLADRLDAIHSGVFTDQIIWQAVGFIFLAGWLSLALGQVRA